MQREKDMENMKDSLRVMEDTVRRNNMYLIRVSWRKEKEWYEVISEELMAEKFSEPMKGINL